ncbi:MAG: hypothetical protein ACYS22_13230 [Planctomycetota bacterium]|jgi:hypothetical protein
MAIRHLFRPFDRTLDELIITGAVMTQGQRAFSRTRAGEPPRPEELFEASKAYPPKIHWPDRFDRPTRIRVELPVVQKESFLDFRPGRGEVDTLWVYHHGLGEIPHDAVAKVVHRSKTLGGRCDLIMLKAVHHRSQWDVRQHFLRCRSDMIGYIAASTAVAAAVGEQLRPRYKHLVLSGTSLGGMITLSQSIFEPHYDLYCPFVAGPMLSEVLLNSSFSRTVSAGFRRRERKAPWLRNLDLDQRLRDSEGPPIRALLGRSDRLFRLDAQLRGYKGVKRAKVSIIEGGHISTPANVRAIARHLKTSLREVCWPATADEPAVTEVTKAPNAPQVRHVPPQRAPQPATRAEPWSGD